MSQNLGFRNPEDSEECSVESASIWLSGSGQVVLYPKITGSSSDFKHNGCHFLNGFS